MLSGAVGSAIVNDFVQSRMVMHRDVYGIHSYFHASLVQTATCLAQVPPLARYCPYQALYGLYLCILLFKLHSGRSR